MWKGHSVMWQSLVCWCHVCVRKIPLKFQSRQHWMFCTSSLLTSKTPWSAEQDHNKDVILQPARLSTPVFYNRDQQENKPSYPGLSLDQELAIVCT